MSDNNLNPYPEEMRLNLWPLCCGASILSGFKHVPGIDDDELHKQLDAVLESVPYNQVYKNEQMRPQVQFVVLNATQMGSPRIVKAVTDRGFRAIATFARTGKITLFVRDLNNSFKLIVEEKSDAVS